jgi:hypothetical protein
MRKLFPLAVAGLTLIGLAGCAPAESVSTDTAATESAAPVESVEISETETSETDAAIDAVEATEAAATESKTSALDGNSITSEEVILAALMGPDGEYAAAASYLAVLEAYGDVEPYATIYSAELRHADALIRQLERLGVEVPENPYLGQIQAPADLETAALAWAEGEVLNIELYDYLLTMTDDAQLTKVLNNLRSASLDSHLPAFEAAAESGGTLASMPAGH